MLCAAVHGKRECVDGKRGQQHSRAGGGHRAVEFVPALCPTQPELALQPASLGEVRNACPQPQGPVLLAQ